MKSVIELSGVTKTYGTSRGVEDVSLSVPSGTIFGFLGPNGAGKTTTISMLVNLTAPTAGNITILGKDTQTQGVDIRKDIGYLSNDMALDGHLTGRQQLEFFGNIRGEYNKAYVKSLAERLDCDLSRKIRTLSRGNRQKVALISALMHKPKLLILDEPTSGLDPLIQAEFNKIILEHRKQGRSTFISSHVLSEIQELCDHVAFIRQGKLVASMTLQELLKAAPKHVSVSSKDKKLVAALRKLDGVKQLEATAKGAELAFAGNSGQLLGVLSKHKIDDVTIENADLEKSFMAYYEVGVDK